MTWCFLKLQYLARASPGTAIIKLLNLTTGLYTCSGKLPPRADTGYKRVKPVSYAIASCPTFFNYVPKICVIFTTLV